jgi:transglutaminase-like putative cysteine protease
MLTTREKWIVGGLLGAAAIGAGFMIYQRSYGSLGRVVDRKRKGGMTNVLHHDPIMPIEMRVKLIQRRVYEGVMDPQMRELALAITGDRDKTVRVGRFDFDVKGARCKARDVNCEIRAVYNWVKNNIRYTGDVAPIVMPNGEVDAIDYYSSGKRTVEIGGEDCDGHTILMATLLALNGVTSKMRITAPKGSLEWGHIYPIAGVDTKESPRRFIAVDTTLPNGTVGSEAPYSRNRDFNTDVPV